MARKIFIRLLIFRHVVGKILIVMRLLLPVYWVQCLDIVIFRNYGKKVHYEVEDIPFAYTEVSLNKLYELSLKQALQVIEQEGGSVQGEQVVIKTQQPVAVKYEKAF